MPFKVISASTGWGYCMPVYEKGEIVDLIVKPIVAWGFEEIGGVSDDPGIRCFPIPPVEIIQASDEYYAIAMPDGGIEIPDRRTVGTHEEVVSEWNAMKKATERFREYMEIKNE